MDLGSSIIEKEGSTNPSLNMVLRSHIIYRGIMCVYYIASIHENTTKTKALET